jgi:hypothetical protein
MCLHRGPDNEHPASVCHRNLVANTAAAQLRMATSAGLFLLVIMTLVC